MCVACLVFNGCTPKKDLFGWGGGSPFLILNICPVPSRIFQASSGCSTGYHHKNHEDSANECRAFAQVAEYILEVFNLNRFAENTPFWRAILLFIL